ncbi:YybH family protein [Kordia sp.]|uniref:YybH family protein n=1 Tax=Kordia sp. TaxID=1965332 RepID=UPI003B58CCD2
MKLKVILLLIVFLSVSGCKQQESKNQNISNSNTKVVQPKKTLNNHTDWVQAINNNDITALKNSYDANAIKIISTDSIINGSPQIANYYGIHKNKITSIESLFSVEANKAEGITYELIKYQTDNRKEYIQIVIWKLKDKKVIREFEFTEISRVSNTKIQTPEIVKRRKLWMELCNAHNAENLVKQLYSENTMYYNHKPIVKGRESLVKEYGYMNNKKYSLQLQPKKLEIVNANFAFEIGQCSGSYGGKYVLIWKKQADGNWYIYIDSNI